MEENNVMTEEAVDKAMDAVCTAVAALAENPNPTVPVPSPKHSGGKTLLIGGASFIGGGIAGFALDKWVVPKIKKGLADHKAKRAKKKAEKAAKKNGNKTEEKKADPRPATAEIPEDGINPMDINVQID